MEVIMTWVFILLIVVGGLYCLIKKAVKDGIREYEAERNTLNDTETERESEDGTEIK